MILSSASLEAFCEHLKTLEKPKIIVLSGLLQQLQQEYRIFERRDLGYTQKYNLPYAEAIFDIEYFLRKRRYDVLSNIIRA